MQIISPSISSSCKSAPSARPILEVSDLRVHFSKGEGFLGLRKTPIRAVDGVTFSIPHGSCFGLVGESGSGKTTVGRSIARLLKPTAGSIVFNDVDLVKIGSRELRQYRRYIQFIFQDPYTSLNPRMKVGDILGRPLKIFGIARRKENKRLVSEMLIKVGLKPEDTNKFPHQFSGGQRQRIMIARSIITHPRLLILDEPTSSLDVSIQAQILNLLVSLREEFNLTYLFISHNLNVVRYVCDRIAVMYAGKIVEVSDNEELFRNPNHPYTKVLLSSVLTAKSKDHEQALQPKGEIPDPYHFPLGCRFNPRCPFVMDICKVSEPSLLQTQVNTTGGSRDHKVACHLLNYNSNNKKS